MKRNVVIVGGGITGLTTAYELCNYDVNITIFDNHPTSKGSSSWAGAGIISPLYPWKYDDLINDLSLKSQALYPEFAKKLQEVSGIDPEYRRCGLLMLDEYNTPTASSWLKKWKVNFTNTPKGALFDIAHIRNNNLLVSLKKYLKIKKVNFIHRSAKKLIYAKNTVIGVDNILSDWTIICAGSWTNELIATRHKVYPVKGEMITILDKEKSVPHIILKDGKYIVPRKDGIVLIGSTMEDVGFDENLNSKEKLFEFLLSIYPHFKDHIISHHWCGFRPASSQIMIGQHEKYQNLFVNTGHFCNGINTSPQGAKILTKLIMNSNVST